jgi:hypothetical protein
VGGLECGHLPIAVWWKESYFASSNLEYSRSDYHKQLPQIDGERNEKPQLHVRNNAPGSGSIEPLSSEYRLRPIWCNAVEQVSAIEAYLEIEVDQLDRWRAYTSALLDFFEYPHQCRLPNDLHVEVERGPSAAEEERWQPNSRAVPPQLFSERLATQMIAQAEKAHTLKAALDALRVALSAGQLDRLAKAESVMRPHHGRRSGSLALALT